MVIGRKRCTSGGGVNSALEAQKLAIALSPRNVEYQFNLGQIYVAGKKWDLAREVFTRLKEGTDRTAAAAAKQQLADLDTLQKYGVRPQREGENESPAGRGRQRKIKMKTPMPRPSLRPSSLGRPGRCSFSRAKS